MPKAVAPILVILGFCMSIPGPILWLIIMQKTTDLSLVGGILIGIAMMIAAIYIKVDTPPIDNDLQ